MKKTFKNSKKQKITKSNNFISDDKLKPLSPSLRLKKRFIKIKIESDKQFDFKTLSENLNQQIILFLGAVEFSKSGIWILRDKFDDKKQELVLKVSTKLKDRLIGVLSLIQNISNADVNIHILNVSGTLKSLEKNLNKNK